MGPAALVEAGGRRLLFDAGRGTCARLAQLGLGPQDAGPVFLTHHHFDHISDLGDVILSSWNNGGRGPFEIFGPVGTEAIVAALLDGVYGADIAFRLAESKRTDGALADVRRLTRVRDVGPGPVFAAGGISVVAGNVEHGHGLGLSRRAWPCLGYRIEAGGRTLAVSGDAVACEGLHRLAEDADVLLMCCYLAEAEIVDEETEIISRHILASSGRVGRIAAAAGVRTLVLTHFREKADDLLRSVEADARRDFTGTVVLGEDLMSIDI